MALSLESAGLVRQKAREYTRSPLIFYTLKAFFLYWATNKSNADLQFVAYAGEDTLASGGYDTGLDEAHRLYVFYGKKAATAEDVYLYAFDDATNDAGAGTDGRCNLVFLESGDEAIAVYPSGIPMTAGLVVKSYTDFDGTTDTTSDS